MYDNMFKEGDKVNYRVGTQDVKTGVVEAITTGNDGDLCYWISGEKYLVMPGQVIGLAK